MIKNKIFFLKKLFIVLFLIAACAKSFSQSVLGFWYGSANVVSSFSTNNYLVELVLHSEKNQVSGIMNYFFKNSYHSIKVKGNYDPSTRQLYLYDIPIAYHASLSGMNVDCLMNLKANLILSRKGTELNGKFIATTEYKNICPDLRFHFTFDADVSKKDSVLKAIAEFKETYQVWKPSATDTFVQAEVLPRKVINDDIEKEFATRKNEVIDELEVESDSLELAIYDNGEVDGDIISLFYNGNLLFFNQKLTHKAIRITLPLQPGREYNELSMFAENLGLIPPNTALILIKDGKNRYELRLSSNLEKNATIRIRKKTKS
ncbi:MAG: hypothetical protein N2747_05980 [Chitinophagaceae bacterium]|nr:hypothetical protein [Chitinophagaceae bacterium]